MRLVISIAFALIFFGSIFVAFVFLVFSPSEFANGDIENVMRIHPEKFDPNITKSSSSRNEDLTTKNFALNNTRTNASESKISRKSDTDAHIPTLELYRTYLRQTNSTSKLNAVENIISKLPTTGRFPSETPGKNSTPSNISYVDFLMHFANITVHYLPNVTVTNSRIRIQNTVYDSQLKNRTFYADYNKNEFMKDGQTFRYVSAEMHYFRSFSSSWRRKMRAMRAAGFSVISTYIEWSTHNPQDDGKYIWTGLQDAEKFFRMAIEEDLLVILRPSPYICAERNGVRISHYVPVAQFYYS